MTDKPFVFNRQGRLVQKWYEHKTVTGWRKTQPAEKRRLLLYRSTDRRKSRYHRLLEAARRIQALANVNQDTVTKRLARSDALYFYGLAKKMRGKK
jgi:hypothetical protein